MMTQVQMMDRYNELYDKMKDSKDPKNMKVFGEAEKWVFRKMTSIHPDIAESWISHLEAICWDSYISQNEAINIGKRIVNQDGVKGFHWNYDTFKSVVEGLGAPMSEKPYYNCYALFVTANMIYSDHAQSIAEDMGHKMPSEIPNEQMALSCYKKAIEMLKDPDHGFHIRKYFKQKMYDDSPM